MSFGFVGLEVLGLIDSGIGVVWVFFDEEDDMKLMMKKDKQDKRYKYNCVERFIN